MSDAQILTVALFSSVLNTIAVIIGILINNSRLSDLRDQIDSLFDEFRDIRLKHLEYR
jgi:hypothetical protein